jgi:2-Cys peroxiredoxin 5
MKAWAQTLDPEGKSGIRFLADPTAAFTKALDLDFEAQAVFGGPRMKRCAIVVEDGVVKEAHVEGDNTGMSGKLSLCGSRMGYADPHTVSVADKVL